MSHYRRKTGCKFTFTFMHLPDADSSCNYCESHHALGIAIAFTIFATKMFYVDIY